MSITVISTPLTPLESYTHNIWSVTSNLPTISQVRFVFQLNSQDVFSTQVQPSLAGSAYFEADIQEFLRDQLSYDIQDPAVATAAYSTPSSTFSYDRIVIQEFTDLNGKLILAGIAPVNATYTTINAARQTYNAAGLIGYQVQSPTSLPWTYDKFLTNSNRRINIMEGESYQLSLWAKATSSNAIIIQFFDSSGVQVGGPDRIDYTGTAGRYDICVGLANLATYGITVPATATNYYAYIANWDGVSLSRQSEYMYFDIVTKCNGTRVHFLNRWGGFDSFTLNEKVRTASTSSTVYEKYLQDGYSPRDRGRQNQRREASINYTASTNLLSDESSLWLEELATSPAAYIEENGVLIPVTINDGTTVITSLGVAEFTLSFTLANDIHNQRL